MIKKAKRYFNTSGPNIPEEHYTLGRQKLIDTGIEMVKNRRYFTIWAPRQTGKSTYFRLMAKQLETMGYDVLHTNLENYQNASEDVFLSFIASEFRRQLKITVKSGTIAGLHDELRELKEKKIVLIIDEIEGLNPDIFGQFLHTIRNLYHYRDDHAVKSVVLVGVSNIVGVVQDNASPFNIADNLEVPYFTNDESFELLGMHETETGQLFDGKVKTKICEITANQPGLVNGFAYKLVERNPGKPVIDYDDYLTVEDWYLTEAIDKNISNIINKAKQHRSFLEKLLFTDGKEKFKINNETIKFLYSHGLIKKDADGNVAFWVPIYRKAVYDAFFPDYNGESKEQMKEINLSGFFLDPKDGTLDFSRLIEGYRSYVKRRGFRYFRRKDKDGNWMQIKEAAIVYSFEAFIQVLLQTVGGKSYLEPHAGQGNSDMIINIGGKETVIEFKIYRDHFQYNRGKTQVAHYAGSLSLDACIYIVFVSSVYKELDFTPGTVEIDGVRVHCHVIFFDEEKDF